MTLPSITFSGISSPFDSNAIINQLIAAQSAPLNRLQNQRAEYVAQDNAWQSVNTRLSALRTSLDAIGEVDDFVAVSSSDTDSVTASVTGSPVVGSIAFTIDRLATTHQEVSAATFADPDAVIDAAGGDFTVTVDGTDYTFTADGTTTYADLAAEINGLDAGVTATVLETDTDQNQLYMTSNTTGDAAAFTVTSAISGFTVFDTVEDGLDAQITIGSGPGALTIEKPSNTVSDLIDGVTIDLTATTTSAVNVSVSRDADAAADSISSFVDDLNNAINTLDALIDYNAESGTGGALQGDSTARSLLNGLRSAVSGAISGSTTSGSIGVSLERDGTFAFDRSTFTDALGADYTTVSAFIEDTFVDAVDTRLDAAEGASGTVSLARDAYQSRIDFVDDRIIEWEDRLDLREASLVRQFASLDSALSQLNSQSQWLSGQIAALGG